MDTSQRITALIGYIPVIGWLYAVLVGWRKSEFVMFHLRQSIGLVVFLLAVFAGWFVFSYVIAFIPYAALIGIATFTLVICTLLLGVVFWIMGAVNALRGRVAFLPIFGETANRVTRQG
jgi:uncharacterized membrane protein